MAVDLDTFLTAVYTVVDTIYQQAIAPHKPVRPGRKPRVSDSELLTLLLVRQWLGCSERQLLSLIPQAAATAFPQLLSQSAFNRRGHDLYGACLRLGQVLATWLGAGQTPYQVVDGVPVPLAKCCRGERHRCFADIASIGRGGSDRSWYYGCQLLLATTATGVITGWVVGPASTEGRWLLEALLGWRVDPEAATWTAAEVPSSRPGRTVVGPTGPRLSPSSVGAPSAVPYIADDGFAGQAWSTHWATAYQATVLTCRAYGPATPPAVRRSHHAWRQIIETVNAVLVEALHLRQLRVRTVNGLLTRLAAACTAVNLGQWLNLTWHRPALAIGSLLAA